MADIKSDNWIVANSPLSPKRLHAIGVITFFWNQCERWQFQLFSNVSELPEFDAWALAFDIGSDALAVRIRTLMTKRAYHKTGGPLIDNALTYFNHCRQNRNAIVHAWALGSQEGELARKSKKPSSVDPDPFPADLKTLRRVADELGILVDRLWLLNSLIEDESILTPPASLKILPLPSLLLMPPPQPNTKPLRLPRPSAASRRSAAMARRNKA